MTERTIDEPRRTRAAKLPAVLTYDEVKSIAARLAILETKIDQALDMRDDVKSLHSRVHDLELAQAKATSRTDQWTWIINLGWGLLLTLIAAGVWLSPK